MNIHEGKGSCICAIFLKLMLKSSGANKFWRDIASTSILGPRSEKTCLQCLRTTEAQTSLRVWAGWSAPLLSVFWKV